MIFTMRRLSSLIKSIRAKFSLTSPSSTCTKKAAGYFCDRPEQGDD